VTYRIQRAVEPDGVIFLLSGELDAEHVDKLRVLMEREDSAHVRVDLRDVTVVQPVGVTFLARLEPAGVVLVNCADYIRRLIAEEPS